MAEGETEEMEQSESDEPEEAAAQAAATDPRVPVPNTGHFYLMVEVDMAKILQLRDLLDPVPGNGNSDIQIIDFVVKASALALNDVPEANRVCKNDNFRQFRHAHIRIASATTDGLKTTIVRKADEIGMSAISAKRSSERQPEEEQGGSFAITMNIGMFGVNVFTAITKQGHDGGRFTTLNLGTFGIKQFTAIMNPEEALILAVDARNTTNLRARKVMNFSLSCDLRVVDSTVGANWLRSFKKHMEEPLAMLL